jgi:hypothetical protein
VTGQGDDFVAEQRRLTAVSSIPAVVASYVDGLVELRAEDVPVWLTQLSMPAGWRLVRLEGSPVQPARIAVCGQRPDGRWDGCVLPPVSRRLPDQV